MTKSVLIIEDDEDCQVIYSTALQLHGYTTYSATSGAEGIHLARTRRPDLILLDIGLPVMDGWSTLRYLRSMRETRRTPVFAISAYMQEHQPSDLDFDAFLEKPIGAKEVVTAVEAEIGIPDRQPSIAAYD